MTLTRLRARSALLMPLVGCLWLLAPALAGAHSYAVGAIKIAHPWSPPTPNGAPTSAGYLTLTNTGGQPDRLLGASTPDAGGLELHTMTMAGGVMRMRPLAGGLAIAPGKSIAIQPGSGLHLMFERPKHPFKIGDHIPATLRFEHAGSVKVEFYVESAPTAAGMHDHMGGRM